VRDTGDQETLPLSPLWIGRQLREAAAFCEGEWISGAEMQTKRKLTSMLPDPLAPEFQGVGIGYLQVIFILAINGLRREFRFPLRALLAQPLLWMRLKNMVTRQRFDWLSIDESRHPLAPEFQGVGIGYLQVIFILAINGLRREFRFHLLKVPLLWMRLKNMVTRQRFDWLSIDESRPLPVSIPSMPRPRQRKLTSMLPDPLAPEFQGVGIGYLQVIFILAINFRFPLSGLAVSCVKRQPSAKANGLAARRCKLCLSAVDGVKDYTADTRRFAKGARVARKFDYRQGIDLADAFAFGINLMQAFIMSELELEQQLPFSASLTFEQSYSEVDGDSASMAEE
jgi:Lon-like ATP-dependent protease